MRLQPLIAALAIATTTTLSQSASAITHSVSLSGLAANEISSNTAPTPVTNFFPLYQSPRFPLYGGAGWNTILELDIDGTTGDVINFLHYLTEPLKLWRTHIDPSSTVYADRIDNFLAGTQFRPTANFPTGCTTSLSVGKIVYDCPAVANQINFADITATGYQCYTALPTSIIPGENGCSVFWGGPAITPFAALPESYITPEGLSFDVTTLLPNPVFWAESDLANSVMSETAIKTYAAVHGGKFTIDYTGTLNTASFAVTNVVIEHYHNVSVGIETVDRTSTFNFTNPASSIIGTGADTYCVVGTGTGTNYSWGFTGSATRTEINVAAATIGANAAGLVSNLLSKINTPPTLSDVMAVPVSGSSACFNLVLPTGTALSTLPTFNVGPAGGTNCVVDSSGCTYNPTISLMVEEENVPLIGLFGLSSLALLLGTAAYRRRVKPV